MESEGCALAGADCRPLLLRRRAGRPQLKRDPLGGVNQPRRQPTMEDIEDIFPEVQAVISRYLDGEEAFDAAARAIAAIIKRTCGRTGSSDAPASHPAPSALAVTVDGSGCLVCPDHPRHRWQDPGSWTGSLSR